MAVSVLSVSAILIHYRTPNLLRSAVEALLADAQSTGVDLECIVVDNGSGPDDPSRWRDLPIDLQTPGRNLGYAGGANWGVERASGDVLVIMNPDVEVLPGCLTQLVEVLRAGAEVCGPRFFLDHRRQFLLPPTERRRPYDEMRAILARRGGRFAVGPRAAWRRHAQRYWNAAAPIDGFALSGALLAITRQAWQDIGPFDPAYALYFEETDWLERLRRAGGRARFVPTAEAVHLYAQSTQRAPQAEAWFVASSRRFQERHYGRRMADNLAALDQLLAPTDQPPAPEIAPVGDGTPRWLEISIGAAGYPATAARLDDADLREAPLPADLRDRLPATGAILRWVDAAGRELGARPV